MAKYKIKAKKHQLRNFGINFEITNLIGTLKKKYPTGWYAIEVSHECYGQKCETIFDIPQTFLELIEE